jgi:cytochrome c553
MKRFHWISLIVTGLTVAACAGRRGGSASSVAHATASTRSGDTIYREDCARCHGPQGEGVAGQYDETLYGEQSVASLARYIHRTMPDDRPEKTSEADARLVAEFIHGAFYSPQARARNTPERIEFSRLTQRRYRESIADLLSGFTESRQTERSGGLQAEYFQSKGMNKKDKSALQRIDPTVRFDFGTNSPTPDITADQFSIAWSGSVLAPESGEYQFRVTTPNGARLYVNTDLAAGDSNRRDDSDAKREVALIDLWVSSGGVERQGSGAVYLLGGRSYPLRLDYFKFKEKTAAVKLEWKPPHGPWTGIPSSVLSPDPSSATPVIGTAFPADDSSLGYERGHSISKEWWRTITRAGTETSERVAGRIHRLAGIPANQTNRTELSRRMQDFCAQLAERAFRRPLDAELRRRTVDVWFQPGVALEDSVKRSVLAVLTSPRFLYPELEGRQDSHATAARLAMVLWDSLPDEALRKAADRNEVTTPEQIRAQAQRMIQNPRAKAKLRGFFDHWLDTDAADEIAKDPKAYPGFDAELVQDLRTSLNHFVESVVWSPASDYRQLLLSDEIHLNASLRRYYGVEGARSTHGGAGGGSTNAVDDAFVPVRFDPEQRAGVLTHPFLLSAHSYYRSSSPIHRGVFLTRKVLGRFLKPPPMAIEFMDDRFDPSLTMREKVTQLTEKPQCMACHATINPLGFSLEQFDAAGRFRLEDTRKPVNATAEYQTADGKTLTLRGPRDLARHAAESPDARRGFVRQLFQHTVQQAPGAYGAESLPKLDSAFEHSGCNIRQLLVEIAVHTATLDPKNLSRK